MIYAGCSGYSFKEWVGHFYPPKTKPKDYLEHYATKLNSVEINHTFRRFPRLEVIEAWAAKTPEHFRFSFKMHQSVTHMARLKNVGRSVSDFLDALMLLKKRLSVVLFQLPPFFKLNHERLDSFLGELPAGFRYAMEFRHASWSEPAVVEKLTVAGVALCGSELEIDATEIVQTAPFIYLRLRKPPPYTDAEIETLRALVREAAGGAEDLYVYAKHDDVGVAPEQVECIVIT